MASSSSSTTCRTTGMGISIGGGKITRRLGETKSSNELGKVADLIGKEDDGGRQVLSYPAPGFTRIAHALGPSPCAAAGVLLTAPSTARADVGRSARAWALRDRTAIAQRRVPRCGSPDRAAGAFSAPAARCRRSTWRSAVRPAGRSGTGWRWPQGLPSVGRGSCAALRPAARDLFWRRYPLLTSPR